MKQLTVILLSILMSACMHEAENPRDIATQYWQALKNGDTATARSLVSSDSQQAFDEYVAIPAEQKKPIGEINLGAEQTTMITIIYPEDSSPDNGNS